MRAAVALLFAALFLVSPASAKADTIEVTGQITHAQTTSLAPTGRGGDAYSALWLVRDRNGNAVGDMLIDCRWVTSGLRLCVGQLGMPLGTIAVIGASRTRFLGQLAVVGGTGRYVGAEGALLFNATGRGRYVISVQYRTDR